MSGHSHDVGGGAVCLVRHGETPWNRANRLQGHTDVELSADGRAEASRVGRGIAPGGWDVLVSSPLARATQTADAFAAATGVPFAGVEPLLIERCYGAGEGLTPAQLEQRFGDDVPGRESRADAAERGVRALDRLAAGYPDLRVLAVTHGSLIKCLLMRLAPGLAPAALDVALLSATCFERYDDGWVVTGVGGNVG